MVKNEERKSIVKTMQKMKVDEQTQEKMKIKRKKIEKEFGYVYPDEN